VTDAAQHTMCNTEGEPVMSMLVDLANAIEAYPHEFINLEIVEVDPPGNTINEDEDVVFEIHITNTGPLDVLELSILVEGLNGTEVKSNGAAAQWTDAFTYDGTSDLDKIPGHSGNSPVVLSRLHFKHPRSRPAVTDLVRVSVAGFDADFGHMLVAHSRADTAAQATYSSTVSPA
jgi:hypothetical protein